MGIPKDSHYCMDKWRYSGTRICLGQGFQLVYRSVLVVLCTLWHPLPLLRMTVGHLVTTDKDVGTLYWITTASPYPTTARITCRTFSCNGLINKNLIADCTLQGTQVPTHLSHLSISGGAKTTGTRTKRQHYAAWQSRVRPQTHFVANGTRESCNADSVFILVDVTGFQRPQYSPESPETRRSSRPL